MQLRLIVLTMLGILLASPAFASGAEIAALKAVFQAGPTDPGLFDAAFLQAVPVAQLDAALGPMKAQIGPVVSVEARGGPSYAIETATYEVLADIALDAQGKISGLFVHPPTAKNQSMNGLLEGFSSISPHFAYLITKDGKAVQARDPDIALAVGSAFKLGVLKALKDEIDAGARTWRDVLTLSADDISLPSGMLQGWPVGSPLTVHTAAALMISISDNTAADLLAKTVGRDKVEAALGIAPALTTRELFTLKANPDLKARYAADDADGARKVLEDADKLPLPDAGKAITPLDAGIEWYLSPAKLCELIGEVQDLDVMQINPGVASKADWAKVAFKGGSEIGVLSLTTALTGKDGHSYCVSAVWNNTAALDEGKAESAYGSVVSLLAKGG